MRYLKNVKIPNVCLTVIRNLKTTLLPLPTKDKFVAIGNPLL